LDLKKIKKTYEDVYLEAIKKADNKLKLGLIKKERLSKRTKKY
jgi:hypothetical protein